MKKPILTSHIRHARLVKLVRRWYQKTYPGSKLFNNTSGTGWQGNNPEFNNGSVTLNSARPLNAGIPSVREGSGGGDLLGFTMIDNKPIFSTVECKSGNGKLMPNQKNFKAFIKRVGGFFYLARECSTCWNDWEPIYRKGVIVEWKPVKDCPECHGVGFILEE